MSNSSSTIQLPPREAYVNIEGFRFPIDPSGGNTFPVPDIGEGRILFEAGISRYELGNLDGRFQFETSSPCNNGKVVDFIERGKAVVEGPLELTNLGDGRVHVRVVPPPPMKGWEFALGAMLYGVAVMHLIQRQRSDWQRWYVPEPEMCVNPAPHRTDVEENGDPIMARMQRVVYVETPLERSPVDEFAHGFVHPISAMVDAGRTVYDYVVEDRDWCLDDWGCYNPLNWF